MSAVTKTGTQVPENEGAPTRTRIREGATYGEWIRAAPPNQLTRAERKLLHEEREWENGNVPMVGLLDAMVGRTWRLRRDMTTLSQEAEGQTWKRGPSHYPKAMRVRVFARVGAYLLGRTIDGAVLRLKMEWLEAVPPPPPEAGDLDELGEAIAEDATR